MNIENINDTNYTNLPTYKDFLDKNKGLGYLMIRASAASGAIPISNLKIIISKVIDNEKVIFFEGTTDDSGMIERISLPAPTQDENNLDIPKYATYVIEALLPSQNISNRYEVNIYNGLTTSQMIIITPREPLRGGYYGY